MDAPVTPAREAEAARGATLLAIVALPLLLAACILMPGKFTSSLDLRKDGRFSFTYTGEIHFVSPSDLDDKKPGADGSGFEPQPCQTPSGEKRPCTRAETDEQARLWKERKRQEKDAETKQMAAFMGSSDLSDPRTAEEFARKLARQHGWRSVKSMGNGRFDVEYAVTGTLDHDFTFPVIEDFPLANPFVQIVVREDGSVRMNAPGFSSGAGGSPLRNLAQLGTMDEANKESDKAPKLPRMEGVFTLTTDATIRANNTEEGPRSGTTGALLVWNVSDRTATAPTALVALPPHAR